MAYLDQPQMSNRKLAGLGIAILVHVLLGYAFITGLALKVAKKVFTPIETVNIEEKKPEEPPPPPEKQEEIPIVAPPPDVTVDVPPPPTAPVVQTNIVAPPAPPPVVAPPAPTITPPAPPPPAPSVAKGAIPRGDLNKLITTDDYPSSSLRAEEEGTVVATYVIDTQGKVSACSIAKSSGFPRLDETTCTLIQRRFRFKPAQDQSGNPIDDKKSQTVRWQIPKG